MEQKSAETLNSCHCRFSHNGKDKDIYKYIGKDEHKDKYKYKYNRKDKDKTLWVKSVTLVSSLAILSSD